jgi:hypothetical protein
MPVAYIRCPCYRCKGALHPVQARTVKRHLDIEERLLGAILTGVDVSMDPASIAEAAAAGRPAADAGPHGAAFGLDPGSTDYVDGNPISQLMNWDSEIAVTRVRFAPPPPQIVQLFTHFIVDLFLLNSRLSCKNHGMRSKLPGY